MRVEADGKFFSEGGSRFLLRGIAQAPPREATPGTRPGLDGLVRDLDDLRDAGFTVVCAREWPQAATTAVAASGLRLLLRPEQEIWTTLATASRPHLNRAYRAAAKYLREVIRLWRGNDALLGVAVGGGVAGADWTRRAVRRAGDIANALASELREEEPGLLVGWAGTWPDGHGCPEELDFQVADVWVRSYEELPEALMARHRQVGDRPLVVGRVHFEGRGSNGGTARDPAIEIEIALERGVAGTVMEGPLRPFPGRFQSDGQAGERRLPAGWVAELRRLNALTVGDLREAWPKVSVVICAHNAEPTLAECLTHCQSLDYPATELIVVDDGSVDRTPAIAEAHPGVRLVSTPRRGLAEARNTGYRVARGELVAYLDADAYPVPEWLRYVALAALPTRTGGAGGPNIPPPSDPVAARLVALSPGGPLPRLLEESRAQHLPGCNMAFWKDVLDELHGFDPVIWGSEDLEFEWRLLESGRHLGYHPAAMIWHHRRPGVGAFLRQQSGYGRGQAILERRYPDRFPRGYRLRQALRRLRAERPADGKSGSYPVTYVSLPWRRRPVLELCHQWGVPMAVASLLSAPAGLLRRPYALPAMGAGAYLLFLFGLDMALAGEGNRLPNGRSGARAQLAALRLLRPLAFRWGHARGRLRLARTMTEGPPTPAEEAAADRRG